MPRLPRPFAVAMLLAATLAASLAVAPAAAGEPGWRRVELPDSGSYVLRYVPHSLPTSGLAAAVVFLHGSGSSPEFWRPRLEPAAEAAGVVLLVPAPADAFGWGIADDRVTLAEAVRRVGQELRLDPARIALAGHSAGGAYAYFLAYETVGGWSAVLALAPPFRHVLEVADPDYTPPLRLWYGGDDPNYLGGHLTAIGAMLGYRGVAWEAEITPGLGHVTPPAAVLAAGFTFLASQRYPLPPRLHPRGERRPPPRRAPAAPAARWDGRAAPAAGR